MEVRERGRSNSVSERSESGSEGGGRKEEREGGREGGGRERERENYAGRRSSYIHHTALTFSGVKELLEATRSLFSCRENSTYNYVLHLHLKHIMNIDIIMYICLNKYTQVCI